jgi:hypothetical protein
MAEINYNNLYNQLSPLDKLFYDQQFSKNYAPGQENIMLEMKPGYEQMKAAYEAEQKIPKKSFLDRLNPFSSASAAEMPTVPNLSLGYNMPTFNLGTGITNTKAATNMFSPFMDNREKVNQDLIEQIIAENQAKTVRPNIFDIAGGITQTTPMRDLGFDTSYGVANEPDDTQSQEYMDQVQKSQGGGISGLLKFLVGLAVPGAGFLMNLPGRGLEGIRSLNQRIQNTDFGQSRTGAEYMMKRRERKQAERAQEAMPEVYRSAKEQGFTNDRGVFSTNRADKAGTSLGSGQFSPSTSRGRSGY